MCEFPTRQEDLVGEGGENITNVKVGLNNLIDGVDLRNSSFLSRGGGLNDGGLNDGVRNDQSHNNRGSIMGASTLADFPIKSPSVRA